MWPAAGATHIAVMTNTANTAVGKRLIASSSRWCRHLAWNDRSDLDRDLVHLGRRVTGALVDPHDSLFRGSRGQAEDLAGDRIEPGALVVDAFFALDRQVAAVRLGQLLGRDTEEPVVNIHERGHH